MFTLLTPAGTIALLAGVTLPILIALYFLKLRRRTLPVPSTLLWKKAVEDLTVNAPFQRLRQNLLLILQLLVLLLLILSLAQPTLFNLPTGAKRVAILIDQSASMNANDVPPNRLTLAKERAKRYLDQLPDSAEVMLVSFSSRARLLSGYTTQHAQLQALIDKIQPTQGLSHLAEAVQLAEAYAQVGTAQVQETEQTPENSNNLPNISLFSDGRIEDLANLPPRRSRLEWQRVGGEPADTGTAGTLPLVPNVAVINFDARRDYERPERISTFVKIQNFGPRPVGLDMTLYRGNAIQQVFPVTLGAYTPASASQPENINITPLSELKTQNLPLSASRTITFKPFDLDGPGVLRVELSNLSEPDYLSQDNVGYKVLAAPKLLRVLLVTKGNYFLEKALRNLPIQGVDVISPSQWESVGPPKDPVTGERVHDVILMDRITIAEDKLPLGSYLFIGGFPTSEAVQLAGTVENELLAEWDDAHPLLRHVTLGYVYAAKWPRLKLSPQARVLVQGETSPVIFELSRARQRYVVVAFDLLESNWPLKVSFPVFCYNAIRYLSDTVTTLDKPLHPGDSLVVPLRSAAGDSKEKQTVTLILPDKTKLTQPVQGRNEAVFAQTDQQGIYAAEGPVAGVRQFAVNLFDPVESDLTPPAVLSIGQIGQTVTAEVQTGRHNIELWPWLALAGLAIIVLEWWVYNRRVWG